MQDTSPEDIFIEKFATTFGKYMLLPHIAGRIFGYLLICDPPHQSAAQLVERLKIAKSSVSNVMRLLSKFGIVEEIRLPGERSRYYRIQNESWEDVVLNKLKSLSAVRVLFGEARLIMKGKDPEIRQRVEEIDAFYAFLEEEIPGLIDRWITYKGSFNEDRKKIYAEEYQNV